MYLGGGTALKAGQAELGRSQSGLAFIEQAETGAFVVGNPSATEATVTVTGAALTGLRAYELDPAGKRLGEAKARAAGQAVALTMGPASKVEFASKEAVSVFDHRQAMLRKRQAQQEAALAQAKADCRARTAERRKQAAQGPAPAHTVIVVQGEDFAAEGGGRIAVSDKKRAAVGKCIYMWDALGQWVEWTFDVPAEGYYHLTVCYCSELDQAQRELKVNGQVQEPFAPLVFPCTGGWSNGSDDWRLLTAVNGLDDRPLLIKLQRGRNVLRLTNTNGRGINIDYLAVTSPDVRVAREMLAARRTR